MCSCPFSGILTLQPTNHPKTKAAGLVRHQLAIFLAGIPLLVIGTWSIYHNKQLGARPHFVSWHGVKKTFIYAFGLEFTDILTFGFKSILLSDCSHRNSESRRVLGYAFRFSLVAQVRGLVG